MKVLRHDRKSREKPGFRDDQGRIRSVSDTISTGTPPGAGLGRQNRAIVAAAE
ncbi:MAG: hypothetical protein ACRYFY_17255 [Janthinobacterium lividum]